MIEKKETKVFFFGLLFVAFILGAIVLWPVKDILLLAWVVTTLFRPIYVFISSKLKLGKILGTTLTLVILLLSVFFPLTWVADITIAQFQVFAKDLMAFIQGSTSTYDLMVLTINKMNELLAKIPLVDYRVSVDNLKLLMQQNIAPIANAALGWSVNTGVAFAQSFPMFIIFLFIVWYGFPEYDRIISFIKRLSPLDEELDDLYLSRVSAMIRGIAKGIVVIAMIQGVIGAISFAIVGIPYVFFWMVLLVVSAIIPPGTMLITVPAAIYMFSTGNVWQGIFLLAVQFGITSNIDNILRPMLVPKEVEVHPALMLLSVIGGIQVFGIWGFIYGPLVMVVMITSIEIYQKYYRIGNR